MYTHKTYTCIYIYIYIHVHVLCVYIYIYIYIYTQEHPPHDGEWPRRGALPAPRP